MNRAQIVSDIFGQTIRAESFPERRLHSTTPTEDGTSPLHPDMEA